MTGDRGEVSERPKGLDWKSSVAQVTEGSNPSFSEVIKGSSPNGIPGYRQKVAASIV
jgi:hypothetical protein